MRDVIKYKKCMILGGKVYVVGRRDCDVLIPGDATVSRKHAEISMAHPEANLTNVNKLPILKLKDVSKFGTWVNKQKVEGERLLADGDSVYFGSPKSAFMVVYEPLVVTSSCLDAAAKKSVRQSLCTLGSHMVNEWTRGCSLLIMSKISVTIKVICALVAQKQVVAPRYLEVYVKHLQGQSEKPDPVKYIPDLAETQLDPSEVSFNPDSRRTSLFQEMTFIFLNQKQFKKMHMAIELAGGTPILMEEKGDNRLLVADKSVVMNCADAGLTQSTQTWITYVQQLLEKNGKHLIADAEIGYAVLYCSTQKHCNPEYASDTNLSRLPSQSLSQVEPFVPDTETQNRTQPVKSVHGSRAVVNETRRSQQPKTPVRGTQHKSQTEISPVIPAVKEEKISQKSTPQSSRKRSRLVTDEDEEEPVSVASKRVKTEPVTPVKSMTPKQTGNKSSTAGNKSSTDGNKSSTDGNKSSVAGNKSSTDKTKPKKEFEWDSDDGIDYTKIDDVATPSSSKQQIRTSPRNKRGQAASPVPEKGQGSKKDTRGNKNKLQEKEKDNEWGSDDDEIDYSTIDMGETSSTSSKHDKTRSPKRTRKSPSPVPARRKRSPSPVPEGRQKKRATRESRSRSRSPAPKEKIGVKTEILSPAEPKQRTELNNKGERSRVNKREVIDAEYENSEMPSSTADKKTAVNLSKVPAGFITTRKPIQDQVSRNREYEVEPDLPTACVQVDVVSLVARRPKQKERGSGDCPDGFIRWKGKVVRNFKKFKKTHHAGSQNLPKIIGGSDLEVHDVKRSKELDDWFKDSLQAESQHSVEDKRAHELFNFDPGSKRRGR